METLTVEVPRETLRRLEIMGFMNDLNGRDVLCFLIEQGLAVLEKHRVVVNIRFNNRRLAQRQGGAKMSAPDGVEARLVMRDFNPHAHSSTWLGALRTTRKQHDHWKTI